MFISFEGPEGSGKTTVIKAVEKYLVSKNFEVVLTREPGGVAISEKIRDLILDPEHKEMDARTEALLYAASRRQHLVEVIEPALKANKIVLSDRFIDSSLAYQGVGRKIGVAEVMGINNFALNGVMPDLTIFLDVKPEIGMMRIEKRGYKDRLELEKGGFHDRVYEGYLQVADTFNDRIKKVNANQPVDIVVKDVITIIEGYLNE